ncbi:MAG TPA: hypothetical protein VF831_08330, partial [Anaerolineales bacterium]
MRLWRWLVILAPILLGTGLALFFFLEYNPSHNHVVYLRADLGTLSFLAGLLLSVFVGLVFSLRARVERNILQASNLAAE